MRACSSSPPRPWGPRRGPGCGANRLNGPRWCFRSFGGPGEGEGEGPAGAGGVRRRAGGCRCWGSWGSRGRGAARSWPPLAARRAQGEAPAPTLWLRGADLRSGDDGVRPAVARALRSAGRSVAASGRTAGEATDATPDRVARLAEAAGRPLYLLLDGPEEMPPALARDLAAWTGATARWLRAAGARLVVACRPEYWERAGALFPPGLLHHPQDPGHPHDRWLTPGAGGLSDSVGAGAPPACVRLGDLPDAQAERARARYGLTTGAQAAADARHPLALRLLAEVRAALPKGAADALGQGEGADDGPDATGSPDRHEIRRLSGPGLPAYRRPDRRRAPPGAARRRRASARGPGRGAGARGGPPLSRPRSGRAGPPLLRGGLPRGAGLGLRRSTEGLLVPAGTGYRFAHEEFAEWLQGARLDLDAALFVLVHGRKERAADGGGRGAGGCRRSAPGARAPSPLPPAGLSVSLTTPLRRRSRGRSWMRQRRRAVRGSRPGGRAERPSERRLLRPSPCRGIASGRSCRRCCSLRGARERSN